MDLATTLQRWSSTLLSSEEHSQKLRAKPEKLWSRQHCNIKQNHSKLQGTSHTLHVQRCNRPVTRLQCRKVSAVRRIVNFEPFVKHPCLGRVRSDRLLAHALLRSLTHSLSLPPSSSSSSVPFCSPGRRGRVTPPEPNGSALLSGLMGDVEQQLRSHNSDKLGEVPKVLVSLILALNPL